MKNPQQTLQEKVEALIGPEQRFKSAPELARRAQMLNAVDKADNLTRSINRIRRGHDPQLSTIFAIARAAETTVAELLSERPDTEMEELIKKLRAIDQKGGLNRELLRNTIRLIVGAETPDSENLKKKVEGLR
ncbi:hypothetical protein [Burkholderia gladioli]|uniref:hypothetical protein n=1 Tax=Burkholderia gladioli TaxID=28095 RepID=UPI003D24AB8E